MWLFWALALFNPFALAIFCCGLFWKTTLNTLQWINLERITPRTLLRALGLLVAGFLLFAVAKLIEAALIAWFCEDPCTYTAARAVTLPLQLVWLVLLLSKPRAYFVSVLLGPLALLLLLLLGAWFCFVLFLRVAVGLMWRIVEHSKGPWLGLLFILTGILGMIKLLARS